MLLGRGTLYCVLDHMVSYHTAPQEAATRDASAGFCLYFLPAGLSLFGAVAQNASLACTNNVRFVPQEVTRGSCVVGWVQLDNQTQEPVAPVVVAPTMVKHPQATLQMSFIRNNIKSHSHLNHFEVGKVGNVVPDAEIGLTPFDSLHLVAVVCFAGLINTPLNIPVTPLAKQRLTSSRVQPTLAKCCFATNWYLRYYLPAETTRREKRIFVFSNFRFVLTALQHVQSRPAFQSFSGASCVRSCMFSSLPPLYILLGCLGVLSISTA